MIGAALFVLSQSTVANASEEIDWSEYYAPTVVATDAAQAMQVDSAASPKEVARDNYTITDPPPPPPPPPPAPEPEPTPVPKVEEEVEVWTPPLVTPDPGSAQEYAQQRLAAMGLGDDEFACLVALWNRESGWRVNANNASSGAYGIPQALPGSKMASAGDDWETNANTQIDWGLGYIMGRYGSPCAAWQHSELENWY